MKLKKGIQYSLEVLREKSNKEKDFSILMDNFGYTHYYPKYVSKETVLLYVSDVRNNKYIFSTEIIEQKKTKRRFIDNFELKKKYLFNFERVTRYCNINDRNEYNSIILNDINFPEKKLMTKPLYWQLFDGYYVEKILCEVSKVNYDNDKLYLIQSLNNLVHPIFEINKEYKFYYTENFDSDDNFIEMKGIDGLTHRLHKPFHTLKEDFLLYRFFGFNKAGKLIFRQFVNFDTIVSYRALKRLTYDKFREIVDDQKITKMFDDYDNFQNLWIISFCNILEEEFSRNIINGDLDESLIFIEVLIEFEKWILNSGFINTFKDLGRDSLIDVTKLKIEEFKNKKEALEIVLNGQQDFFHHETKINRKYIDNVNIFNNIIKYTSIIEDSKFYFDVENIIFYVIKLGELNFFVGSKGSNEKYELTLLINKILTDSEKILFEKLFINSSKRDKFYNKNNDLQNLSKLTVLLSLINKDFKKDKDFKLNLAKLYKFNALYVDNHNLKLEYLKISLLILFNKKNDINFDMFNWNNFDDIFNLKIFQSEQYLKPTINKITTLRSLLKDSVEIDGFLINTDMYGYIVDINTINSILPYKFFNDNRLNRLLKNDERLLKCKINTIDEYFGNVFISAKYKADSIYNNIFQINTKVKGNVKSIEDYGVFIDLGEFDGLLHNSEIGYNSNILNVGEELELVIIEINQEEEKKLISLTLIHDLLKTAPVLEQIYDCYVTEIRNKSISVVTKSGLRGTISNSNLSYQSNDNNIIKLNEKIKAKLVHIKTNTNEFNPKIIYENPFKNKEFFLNKKFKARIFEINSNLITLKLIDYVIVGHCFILQDILGLNEIEINDIVDFEVTQINIENKSIVGTIDLENLIKNDVKYTVSNIDNMYYYEIANCYEHFAYSLVDVIDKAKYLNLAKSFYGFTQSPKSYYLDIFIRYEEVIDKMRIKKIDDLETNIIEVKLLANSIIEFINDENLTVKIFPNIELIKQTLQILNCYNLQDYKTFSYLIEIINEVDSELEIVSKISSLVLSTNSTPIELKTEAFKFDRWFLLFKYLRQGLLDIEYEDENEIIIRKDFLKIVKNGENINTEFKASIFKPVHDIEKRKLIENYENKKMIALEAGDDELAQDYIDKLNDFNNYYSIKGIKHTAMKSLAAFSNTDGGNLIIGLEDDSNVLGIEYETDKIDFDNNAKDKYLNDLDILINNYIGNNFQKNIDFTKFITVEGKNLLWIKINKSDSPVYLKLDKEGKNKKEFYIRGRVSSPKLEIDEMLDYCLSRFKK